MKKQFIKITDEEFWAKYKPVKNLFKSASGAQDGCAFETYGYQHVHVMKTLKDRPNNIWTELDSGEIISGYHTVNRLAYLITEIPFPKNTDVEVIRESESLRFAIDIPDPDRVEEPDSRWVNVATFPAREDAIAWAREHLGADENGFINVLSVY